MNRIKSNSSVAHRLQHVSLALFVVAAASIVPASAFAANATDTANDTSSKNIVTYALGVIKTTAKEVTKNIDTSTGASTSTTTGSSATTTPAPVVTTPVVTTPTATPVAPVVASTPSTVATPASATSSDTTDQANVTPTVTTSTDNASVQEVSGTPEVATASAITESGKTIFNTIHNFKLSSYNTYDSSTMLSANLTKLLLRSAALIGGLGLVLFLMPGRYPKQRMVSVPVVDAP